VELDDAQDGIGNAAPDYFNRSFCIFEVFAAVESSKQDGEQKVLVFGPAIKNQKTAPWLATKVNTYGYNIVNSRNGQCRWPAEKAKIDAFIESNVGFEELDKLVGTAVADACIYGLQTAAATSPLAADLLQCSGASWSAGVGRTALAHHTKDLKISQQTGDKSGEGMAYGNIGNVLYSLSQYDQAIKYHKKNLEIAQQTGDKSGEDRAYGNIENALYSLGRYDEALEYHKKTLEIAQQTGDKHGEGQAYMDIDIAVCRFDEAIGYHKKKLVIAQQTGHISRAGVAHYNISNASEEKGDTKCAIYHMQGAHACYLSSFGAEHSDTVDAHEQLDRLGGVEEEQSSTRSRSRWWRRRRRVDRLGGVEKIERGPCRCDLVVFQTEDIGYGCDGCGMSAPQGTTLHGCRECDFDLCSPCAENRQQ
jgi:tetratricopeptide (TPR) repeat protein